MILALDLGTTAGWALVAPSGVVFSSGIWRLPAARPSQAYRELADYLAAAVAGWPGRDVRSVELVAYEAVPAQAHAGGDAAHRWGGFEALVLAECERTRTRYLGVGIARWKRAAGLRSGSGPAAALAAARARWPGVAFASADEAVARWVGVAAAER